MHTSEQHESFQSLLLLHRGRTGLTQRELAARIGVHTRSVQDWEAGVNSPGAERLQALLVGLFDAGGLIAGRETTRASAARQCWRQWRRYADARSWSGAGAR